MVNPAGGTELDALADAGIRAHPKLVERREAFTQHLEGLGADEAPPQDAHLADLYLAYLAGCGDEVAVAMVRERFGGDIDRALGKAASTGQPLDELRQRVWVRFLTGEPPHLHRYAGRGSLQGWIRVVVSRMVVDLLRSHGARKESSLGPAVLAELGRVELDPQLELLRHRYRDDVQAAMESAFGELSDKDRRLLRGQLVERLSTDDLGALYGVHRTTAARWAEQARLHLVQAAHAELQRRIGGGEETVRSVVDMVRSQLDLSVARLLASKDG